MRGEKKKWCIKTKMMIKVTSKQGQVYHLMRGKIILCLLMLALIYLSHLSLQISR